MADAPRKESLEPGEARPARGASWLVRPLLVSALLIALPAYLVFRAVRSAEKPKAPEAPTITMAPIDPAVEAAREKFSDKRIVVAFHPHLYSRTKSLLSEFAESLALPDFFFSLD